MRKTVISIGQTKNKRAGGGGLCFSFSHPPALLVFVPLARPRSNDGLSASLLPQVLRIRILDEVPDKMEAEAEDSMEADDVTMLKQLEKNLLRLQLSGIGGISKVRT